MKTIGLTCDTVMGGVSRVVRNLPPDITAYRSSFNQNNGGFIQTGTVDPSEPRDKTGIKIKVKGNGDVYYLHIRNASTRYHGTIIQLVFK